MTEEVKKTVDPNVKKWKRLSVIDKKIEELKAEREQIVSDLKTELE